MTRSGNGACGFGKKGKFVEVFLNLFMGLFALHKANQYGTLFCFNFLFFIYQVLAIFCKVNIPKRKRPSK